MPVSFPSALGTKYLEPLHDGCVARDLLWAVGVVEEVLEADLILHVRDISHPETDDQSANVLGILNDLGVQEATPQIEIWNKIDVLDDEARAAREAEALRKDDIQAISALTGAGIEEFVLAVTEKLDLDRQVATVEIDHADGKKRAWAYEQGIVLSETRLEDGVELTVNWTSVQAARFSRL